MNRFPRKFIGRTTGAFLFAFILFTPSAAGACATTPYAYTVNYTPLNPASTPPAVGVPYTYNYYIPRTVAQSSMSSLPATISTATQWDNGTGLATSSQLRPATLEANSTTYNYQINQPSQVDNWVDQGSNHWHSNVVDQGSNHWHSNWVDLGSYHWHDDIVDQGSWHWHSNVVDRGYWVSSGYYAGGWQATSVWNDTSHPAWETHRNRYLVNGNTVFDYCYNQHTHDPPGHCGGHAKYTGYQGHTDLGYRWHSTGFWSTVWVWNPNINWVDTSYWQSVWVDEGSNHWHSNLVNLGFNHWHYNVVDQGFNEWHSSWVDLGSNHWHTNMVNVPITVYTLISYTDQPSLPAGAINVTYNARYVAQDQYLATSLVPGGSAYQITYNYAATLTGCALPT